MDEKRLVRVPVSFEFILDLVKRSYVVTRRGVRCIRGLPTDAVLVSSYTDWDTYTGYLVFSHPSFEILKEGQEIPIFSIHHGVIFEFNNPFLRALDWLTETMMRMGYK